MHWQIAREHENETALQDKSKCSRSTRIEDVRCHIGCVGCRNAVGSTILHDDPEYMGHAGRPAYKDRPAPGGSFDPRLSARVMHKGGRMEPHGALQHSQNRLHVDLHATIFDTRNTSLRGRDPLV